MDLEIIYERAVTPASAHVDSLLSNFATRYENGIYIADQISPVVGVEKLSGKYATRNRRDMNTQHYDRFGPQGRTNEVTYDIGTSSYQCEERGLHCVVPAEVESNADEPIDPAEWAVEQLMNAIGLLREIRIATQVFTSGNWASANTSSAGNAWSDKTNGTPLDDIHTMIAAMPPRSSMGRRIGVCALEVYHALSRHPQMLDLRAGGGTQDGALSEDEIARFFKLDGLFVSDSTKDTANPGQTASYSRVWTATKFAILQVPEVVMTADAQVFSFTPRHRPGMVVRRWRDEGRGRGGSEIVQVEYADDEVVAQNDQGYLLEGVLA